MAVKTSPSGGHTLPKPTKYGWHLVVFDNGDAALVRWTGKKWAWGSLKHPAESTISRYTYLAPNIKDVAEQTVRFDHALAGLTAKQAGELMALMDVGKTGQKGQPGLVTPSGTPNKGFSAGGDAKPVNIIPSPSISNPLSGLAGDFGFLTSTSFWKGIGLVLAGGLILVFAALEFRKMT